MKLKSKPVIYWDSCVFLAYIKDEEDRAEGEMAGVYAVANEVFEKKIQLMTSAVVFYEVRRARLNDECRARFDKIFDLSNVTVVELSPAIGDRAGQLADYYQNLDDGRKGLSRNDAYHLATAIAYEVTVFHTFDKEDKKNSRGLLELDGNVAGFPLRMCKPGSVEGTLTFDL